MTSQKLIHLSHYFLIFGGMFAFIAPIFFTSNSLVIWGFLMVGWIGVHLRQIGKMGFLGHFGLGLIFFSSILPLFIQPAPVPGQIYLHYVFVAILQYLGIVIYGIATLRAKALPKEVGYILLVTIPLAIIFGIGLDLMSILIGLVLLFKKEMIETNKPISLNQEQV